MGSGRRLKCFLSGDWLWDAWGGRCTGHTTAKRVGGGHHLVGTGSCEPLIENIREILANDTIKGLIAVEEA
jgi:hypothetical protein